MCIYPIYYTYVYIYCHILFYFLFIDFFIQFFFIDSYKERCIKYVWWNWSFAELLRNMFHVWNLSFPLGTSHLRQIQIDLQAEKDPKEKTPPIFRWVTRWRFMNSAVFRFTDNRTRIRAALGGIDGQSSPIVDIDVDWSEGCGSRPSKQSNLSVDSPSHVAVCTWPYTCYKSPGNRQSGSMVPLRVSGFPHWIAAAVPGSRKFRRIDLVQQPLRGRR